MGDDMDVRDTKRKTRNLSEKKRRDQFNILVSELSSMVCSDKRKMDKSTVLKSVISLLKNHSEVLVKSRINEIGANFKPSFLTNEEFIHLVLEAVNGFIMVFSSDGKVFYVSGDVTPVLGQLPADILTTTFYEMVHESDRKQLLNLLSDCRFQERKVSFCCRLKRNTSDSRYATYAPINFLGYLKTDADTKTGSCGNKITSDTVSEADSSFRMVFVGIGSLHIPQLTGELPLAGRDERLEFASRHSLEWKFLFLDHRAASIIGYLPFELLGTSGYEYYHIEDIEKLSNCHKALMKRGEGTSCNYRFLTKGQQWIWLQTRFYITYHQWNSKPEFVVCNHRVVSRRYNT